MSTTHRGISSTSDSAVQANVSWMEHQMLEHIKDALRVTVSWKAPSISAARKRSSVAFALKSFQRHLERLMEIEEEGGYMHNVAESKPNLQPKMRELREEHDEFRLQVVRLVESMDAMQDWAMQDWQDVRFEQACGDIESLLDRVDEHDQAEVSLLQEILLCDEGGEG